jgi:pyruvate/2-oxoglutarate dehydrogenase complex dihydrolipoamide acyltransferase (E2) component
LKSEGDYLEPGDAIAEIETDKATMEVEAVDPGFLKQILVAEDTENVPVNTPIAIMTETESEQLAGKQVVNEQIVEETYSKNVNKQENTKG